VTAQITNGISYTKKIQVTAKRTGTAINITGWNETQ